ARGAVAQAALALEPIPAHPLARAADADPRSRGRRRQPPTLDDHPLGQPPPTTPTERRVTVKPHPDLLLGAESAWQPPASKEARMDQRAQELHLGRSPRPSSRRILNRWPQSQRGGSGFFFRSCS